MKLLSMEKCFWGNKDKPLQQMVKTGRLQILPSNFTHGETHPKRRTWNRASYMVANDSAELVAAHYYYIELGFQRLRAVRNLSSVPAELRDTDQEQACPRW